MLPVSPGRSVLPAEPLEEVCPRWTNTPFPREADASGSMSGCVDDSEAVISDLYDVVIRMKMSGRENLLHQIPRPHRSLFVVHIC